MAEGKKITDINPTKKNDSDDAEVTPTISKHPSSVAGGSQYLTAAKEDKDVDEKDDSPKPSSSGGVTIQPINQEKDDQSEESNEPDETSNDQSSDTTSPDDNSANKADPTESEQKEAPQPEEPESDSKQEAFKAQDSLPDDNDHRTSTATDEMQNPKIFDTKEYHVPIKKTAHNHGGLGIALAGVITAIIVAAVVAFAAVNWF